MPLPRVTYLGHRKVLLRNWGLALEDKSSHTGDTGYLGTEQGSNEVVWNLTLPVPSGHAPWWAELVDITTHLPLWKAEGPILTIPAPPSLGSPDQPVKCSPRGEELADEGHRGASAASLPDCFHSTTGAVDPTTLLSDTSSNIFP